MPITILSCPSAILVLQAAKPGEHRDESLHKPVEGVEAVAGAMLPSGPYFAGDGVSVLDPRITRTIVSD